MIRKRLMTEINLASLRLKDNFQSIFYSEELQDILTSTLEQKYGGSYTSHWAARIIQQAYRQYRLKQKLTSSLFYDTKSVYYRNNSMPDNLHYLNDADYGTQTRCLISYSTGCYKIPRSLASSRIKDSLSLLLPELQVASTVGSSRSESSTTETDIMTQEHELFGSGHVKVGDLLSTKCEEDLENFQNCSIKTESTEDSDSSSTSSTSERTSSILLQDNASILKLPPPMPVISTTILSLNSDKRKSKLFSFDKFTSQSADYSRAETDNSGTKCAVPSRLVLSTPGAGLQFTRSPRDSGVSSHSSNTDLLTLEYPGPCHQAEMVKGALYPQRPQSAISPGTLKAHGMVSQSYIHKELNSELESTIDNYIPPISEDNDSLFDSASVHPIPSVMTSSKDSGVDADSVCGLANAPGYLRRLSFQDRPVSWRYAHRPRSTAQAAIDPIADKIHSSPPCSPWLKSDTDKDVDVEANQPDCKEMMNRVLYRVAVNLFNRNTAVGIKFMEDHHLFNVRCPIEIANFLRSREINLQVLAEFISCRNSAFHLQVLRCFLQNLPLQNLSFLEAFDMFISSLKLPDDSIRINYLVAQFCQYYTRHIQRCAAVDLGALMGLSRVIILLKSSVIKSRLMLSTSGVLSFPDFVKNVQTCFKGHHMPYNMEMLQKIYIGITRSNSDHNDLAESLINRIGNIEECKSRSTKVSNGYLQQSYRRLTYCCDVQQSDVFGKKLKKNEHLRSIFVFNDTIIVAKRLSRTSAKQSKLFKTDSKFQCKLIINLLNHRVTRTTCPGASYQISIDPCGELSNRSGPICNQSIFFICDSESSRDKLLSKITMSQLECQCVEQLRLQQWNCIHDRNRGCMCLTTICNATVTKTQPSERGA